MKLDLDDLERKARPIAEWDEERDAEEQQCVGCKSSVHTPPDLDPSPLCNQCAQAYAGETAPVVLALIARVRELEAALNSAASCLEARSDASARRMWATAHREIAAKGTVLP